MHQQSKFSTQDLWRKDRDHSIHPWTDFSRFKEEGSLIIGGSEGAYVEDTDGKRYLDAIAGLWCVNIGYGREEMAEAIAEQAKQICYYCTFTHLATPPAATLAGKLAELAPKPLNHVFFGTGGSMANETAIRTIQFYFNRLGKKNKKHIISRLDAYHGSTYLMMSITGVLDDHVGFDVIKDFIHHIPAPNVYRRPPGVSVEEFCDQKVADLENKILELGPENVACFIAEPIMGAGGVIVPPPGYHKRTWEICKKYEDYFKEAPHRIYDNYLSMMSVSIPRMTLNELNRFARINLRRLGFKKSFYFLMNSLCWRTGMKIGIRDKKNI